MFKGDASKLAGKLSFGCSHMFRRIGRAMLRPLFDQKSKRNGHVSEALYRCVDWWEQVLTANLAEKRPWTLPKDRFETFYAMSHGHGQTAYCKPSAYIHVVCVARPAHLFCDASSTPPYLGAVLLMDGGCWWTHSAPSKETLQQFTKRRDNQIMGLELVSISLGLGSFQKLQHGRRVVIHSDNKGSEVHS